VRLPAELGDNHAPNVRGPVDLVSLLSSERPGLHSFPPRPLGELLWQFAARWGAVASIPAGPTAANSMFVLFMPLLELHGTPPRRCRYAQVVGASQPGKRPNHSGLSRPCQPAVRQSRARKWSGAGLLSALKTVTHVDSSHSTR